MIVYQEPSHFTRHPFLANTMMPLFKGKCTLCSQNVWASSARSHQTLLVIEQLVHIVHSRGRERERELAGKHPSTSHCAVTIEFRELSWAGAFLCFILVRKLSLSRKLRPNGNGTFPGNKRSLHCTERELQHSVQSNLIKNLSFRGCMVRVCTGNFHYSSLNWKLFNSRNLNARCYVEMYSMKLKFSSSS